MWKLKIGEDGAWLSSVNDHIGRQHWEFDPHAGTPQELALVETLRRNFNHNRFQLKQSSDLLMRMQEYTNLQGNRANLVQTAWALLSLIDVGQANVDPKPIHRGNRVMINSQMEDGDFPQQEITGVFMRNCTLNYSSYRNIFPIWALGEYRSRVLSV
ncbi:hypothetical protein LWI29_002979 [Acer saccharum]|uniref:Squalene cyclase C-terminal domain-containing protein n=1 Tax=Acer saccharum TaxID=4024 RepID=A0AA39RBY8_ACESA|nr:hypothetical protein LWI29_002979 [Acer saccharum]